MTTPSKSRSVSTAGQKSNHEGFLRLLPAIALHASVKFRYLRPEAREEAVQEVIANALVAYSRLVELGKEDLAYAGPLATYAVKQVRDGRRVGGSQNINDVMSQRRRQRNDDVNVESLDRFNDLDREWEEIVVEDRRSTPADIAATRIDFRAWLRSLSRRQRKIALALAKGETTKRVATLFELTPGRVSQMRRELKHAWEVFQGEGLEAGPAVTSCG